MPARTVESSPGNRVIETTCEDCGSPAAYGESVNLRAALATGDVRRAGRWYCGWNVMERKPMCIKGRTEE